MTSAVGLALGSMLLPLVDLVYSAAPRRACRPTTSSCCRDGSSSRASASMVSSPARWSWRRHAVGYGGGPVRFHRALQLRARAEERVRLASSRRFSA